MAQVIEEKRGLLIRVSEEANELTVRLSRRPGVLAVLGVGLIVFFVAAALLVVASFSGKFSQADIIRVEIPAGGSAVLQNSNVEYRGVSVGTVISNAESAGGGKLVLKVRMAASKLASIPAGVRATVGPASVFGNQYVQLVPPPHPTSHATLAASHVIPPLTNGTTPSVQATLGDLDKLLIEAHPAQLYAGLSSIAGALQGQGAKLGRTLVAASKYLATMQPLWPKVVTDLKLIVPTSNQLAVATPNFLGLIRNSAFFSRTISGNAGSVRSLITGGSQLAARAARLFRAIEQPYTNTVAGGAVLLKALSQNPREIDMILRGLAKWSKVWSEAERQGPYMSLNGSPVYVKNPADLVLADLGPANAAQLFNDAVHPGFADPSTYTSADCPRYGTEPGSNCAGAASYFKEHRAGVSLDAKGEEQAGSLLLAALNHGKRPPSASLAGIMVSPLLLSMRVGQR